MTTSQGSNPGAQFDADAMSIINTLRTELSNSQFQVLTQRAQLESADKLVAALREQVAQAIQAAHDAQELAESRLVVPAPPEDLVRAVEAGADPGTAT